MTELEKEKLKKKAMSKAKERLEIENKLIKDKRKKMYLYNTLSFIGIVLTSLIVSFLSNDYKLGVNEFFTENLSEKLAFLSAIIVFFVSFSSGLYVSYKKTKFDKIDIKIFLRDTYLDKINSSSLNPNRE